jgi:hypothetical protein
MFLSFLSQNAYQAINRHLITHQANSWSFKLFPIKNLHRPLKEEEEIRTRHNFLTHKPAKITTHSQFSTQFSHPQTCKNHHAFPILKTVFTTHNLQAKISRNQTSFTNITKIPEAYSQPHKHIDPFLPANHHTKSKSHSRNRS